MALVSLEENTPQTGLPVFNLGFRPFFLGALYFGATSILLWVLTYWTGLAWYPQELHSSLWHAHEMLFGYAGAVIAGFLLTAVQNWTQQQMPHQLPLALLFGCWLLARILVLTPGIPLWLLGLVDIGFNLWMLVVVAIPVLRVKQAKQYPILIKLVFLVVCNSFFYAEAAGLTTGTASKALYIAFFVTIGLILMMSRRLIPFFTESGLGVATELRNSKVLDLSSMVLFVAFMLVEVYAQQPILNSSLAASLFAILAIRGIWWHRPGIWRRPLLWSLHLAYWFMTLGMLAYALVPFTSLSSLLALHTLAIGGIGLITTGMMARVALGHTGRDIHTPPLLVNAAFLAVLASVLIRVPGALMLPQHYVSLVIAAGVAWFIGLLILALGYTPILMKKRVDNQYG